MKKTEMIKEIEKIIALVEDQEKFSEKLDLKDGQYFPCAYGYLVGNLQALLEREKI